MYPPFLATFGNCIAKMIAISKPSKNQYFKNKAQAVRFVDFIISLNPRLFVVSGAIVTDFSVKTDGVNVFRCNCWLCIVASLANEALFFNLDSFIINFNKSKKSKEEKEVIEEEERKRPR